MLISDFLDLIITDIDEDKSDSIIRAKLLGFLNRAHKLLVVKEKTEKSTTITIADGEISKPSDFVSIVKVLVDDEVVDSYEQADKLIVDSADGTGTLIYIPSAATLTESDTTITNPANDDYLINYIKYLYYLSEEEINLAQLYKAEADNFRIIYHSKRNKRRVGGG